MSFHSFHRFHMIFHSCKCLTFIELTDKSERCESKTPKTIFQIYTKTFWHGINRNSFHTFHSGEVSQYPARHCQGESWGERV